VILLSGSGCYVVEGRRYQLLPGDIVLVGSKCVHKPEFESGVSYERVILYIMPEFLQMQSTTVFPLDSCFSGEQGHVLRPRDTFRRQLLSQAEKLEGLMANPSAEHEILSRCALLELLVSINREMKQRSCELPSPVIPKDGKVLDILRYLDENLTEEIRIDDLAARFYISKYHMMRRFREETGSSIHIYLSDKRLLMARDLIRSGISATDACFQCGFRSYSAFSRAYGKLFGNTPTGREGSGTAADGMEE